MLDMIKGIFELALAIGLLIGLYIVGTEIYGIAIGTSGQVIRETLFLTVKYRTVGLSFGEQVKYAACAYLFT